MSLRDLYLKMGELVDDLKSIDSPEYQQLQEIYDGFGKWIDENQHHADMPPVENHSTMWFSLAQNNVPRNMVDYCRDREFRFYANWGWDFSVDEPIQFEGELVKDVDGNKFAVFGEAVVYGIRSEICEGTRIKYYILHGVNLKFEHDDDENC